MLMAEKKTLDGFVESLSDRQLHCRELGHTWKPQTVHWDSEARAYDRRLRCPSCRTVRVQLLNTSGHVLANRYVYEDGYLAKGLTVGQVGRDAFRLAAVTRYLDHHPPVEAVAS